MYINLIINIYFALLYIRLYINFIKYLLYSDYYDTKEIAMKAI